MIRFVDLGKQLEVDEDDPNAPRAFAFYNTITSQFLVFDGQSSFESYEDLLEQMEYEDPAFLARVVSLIPAWVPRGKPTRIG